MKKYLFVVVVVMLFVLSGCTASKTVNSKDLYGTVWELDYISGPRIAFDGLFPEKKPQITFLEQEHNANGSTGCNGFSTSFTTDGNSIKIEQPQAMTMRYCEGGGEKVFLQTMEKVNKFSFDKDNKLNLMIDDVPMMRFKKAN
jgi:heat shock protein HslJ